MMRKKLQSAMLACLFRNWLFKSFLLILITFAYLFVKRHPEHFYIYKTLTGNLIWSASLSMSDNSSADKLNSSSPYSMLSRSFNFSLKCAELMKFETFENSSTSFNALDKIIQNALNWQPEMVYSEELIISLAENCSRFFNEFYFPASPRSEREQQFPIAFTLIVHRNIDQFVRLLQAIYWPQNIYIVHIDLKSSQNYKDAVAAVGRCFDNVYMTKRTVDVVWGKYSPLIAAVNSLFELILSNHPWKYAQIVSGIDFPLRTNREIVEILSVLDGSNDCSLVPIELDRVVVNYSSEVTSVLNVPPGVVPYKGSYQCTLSRAFVEFMFSNKRAQEILEWMSVTAFPDEMYWSTLMYNLHLGAPGAFPGQCIYFYDYFKTEKPWISRYQVFWNSQAENCRGQMVQWSCVYGLYDLPTLVQRRKEIFAHKFYQEYQPAAIECLRQWHYSKTYLLDQERLLEQLNLSFYHNLPAVRYHKMPDKTQFKCV